MGTVDDGGANTRRPAAESLSDRAIPLVTALVASSQALRFAQARAEITTIAAALEREYPVADQGQTVALRT